MTGARNSPKASYRETRQARVLISFSIESESLMRDIKTAFSPFIASPFPLELLGRLKGRNLCKSSDEEDIHHSHHNCKGAHKRITQEEADAFLVSDYAYAVFRAPYK